MRLDPSLNVIPEGSLVDLPAAVGNMAEAVVGNMAEDRERKNKLPEEGLQGAPFETANMDISDMCVKTKPENTIREAPGIIQMLPLVTYTKILPIVLPTCRPTSEPTYCPAVGQHVY